MAARRMRGTWHEPVHGSLRQAQDRLWLTTNGSRLINIAQNPFVVRRRRRDRRSSAAVSNHASTRSVDHQGNADQVLLVRSPSTNERMAPSFRSWFDGLTTNGTFCSELVDRQHGISGQALPLAQDERGQTTPFVVSPSNHERLSPPPFVVSLSNHERIRGATYSPFDIRWANGP